MSGAYIALHIRNVMERLNDISHSSGAAPLKICLAATSQLVNLRMFSSLWKIFIFPSGNNFAFLLSWNVLSPSLRLMFKLGRVACIWNSSTQKIDSVRFWAWGQLQLQGTIQILRRQFQLQLQLHGMIHFSRN